jgi:LL-diaminopimelate aminotransferase
VTKPALGRYGFGLGYMPYREAIVSWMERRFGVRFDPLREVVPLIGSKEGLGHLAFAYLERGYVAIIPEPGYLSYLGGALLSEATVYSYPLRPRTNFLVELDDVPDDVLRRARIVYLNYPNNPTAAIAPRDYLERIVQRCRELDLLLVYDNAYSELAFDGYRPPSIFEIDGARDVALEFHSLSKTYNMTGWRCGWAVGRPEFVAALAKVKSFLDTGQFMAVQAAGVAALESWSDFVPKNVATFKERRDAGLAAWRAAGFTGATPRATMYLWLELPTDIDGAAFVETLLQDGVIVIPGSSFGAGGDGFFRVSLTVPPDRLREAARRAGEVLARMTAAAH